MAHLKLGGMNCEHCAAKVQEALEKIEGVQKAAVSLESQSADVDLSGDVSAEMFASAVSEAGYQFVEVE